jgi:DNA polymerase III subunit delta
LIRRIRMNLDRDPLKAAKDFFFFLEIAGWKLDDLADRGWEKITDEQWHQIVGEPENTGERRDWLSKIIDFCVANEVKMPENNDKADLLADVLLRGIPDGNHLVLTTDAVDKRKRIFKIIAQKGKVLNFSQVKGEAKQRNLVMETSREHLSASGKKMTPNAWTAIGKKTGFSLRSSMEALDKLINYTGDRRDIQDTDVEEIIEKIKEDNVFDLTSALVKKELGTALLSLDELLDRGVNHAQILSMIAREIRLLLHGKIYSSAGLFKPIDQKMDFNRFQKTIYPAIREIAATKGKGGKQLAGMHPYVLYNIAKNSKEFSTEKLIGYLQDLVVIDISLKTTAKDPRLLLERFIVKFCA